MPMTSDLTNFTNNIAVRSNNKTVKEKALKVSQRSYSQSNQLSSSTRGLSPGFNPKSLNAPVEL